jgi:Rrf2 family transcriptional regulator, iron-sulfur cluster assembly transcription factor
MCSLGRFDAMQLSTKGRYAVMALVDLAAQQDLAGTIGPICLADIARRQQLSLSYLEQLFGKMRRAGLVYSARGPGGGYRLARRAEDIVIAEIVAAVDEPIRATRCEAGSGGGMVGAGSSSCGEKCQTHDLWFELGRQIALFLEGLTLADVVDGRVRGRAVGLPALRPA